MGHLNYQELVIFVGLQASGKSTFFRSYFAKTHAYVSKDRFRNHKNRSRRQTQLIEMALEAGQSVVVDNTNPTLSDRASIIQLASTYGCQIIGYYFESDLNYCLERNQQRVGKNRVPDVAIYATIKRLIPPTYSEGFHKLFSVRILGNYLFEITDYLRENS